MDSIRCHNHCALDVNGNVYTHHLTTQRHNNLVRKHSKSIILGGQKRCWVAVYVVFMGALHILSRNFLN
jgi:hypothetical protein